MALNEKYSHKDFTYKILLDTNPVEWNNSEVVNSCFYNETPKTQVFPVGITGVTFVRCNLDNVTIPPGCTTEDCSTRLIKVQNDMEDWVLDVALKPIEPIGKTMFTKLGLSIDPMDIPVTKKEVSVVIAKRQELEDALRAEKDAIDAAAVIWRK